MTAVFQLTAIPNASEGNFDEENHSKSAKTNNFLNPA